jgi:uncharacterized protein (TIGR02301 family)
MAERALRLRAPRLGAGGFGRMAGVLAIVVAMSAPTIAAPAAPPAAVAAPAAPPAPKEIAPYDDQLLRLAEILGTLHHLRPLCGADEAQTWRNQMSSLIDAEQPAPERKRRLVERFNRAWRGVAEIHRTCTPAARDLAERLITEGAGLTHEVVSRWGTR